MCIRDRCSLVGILEEGAAPRGESPRAATAGCKAMIRATFICVTLLLAAASAVAQMPEPPAPGSESAAASAPAGPRTWSSMSSQQQQLMHNYQGKWDSLP